jgi:hypothetical protein
MVASPAFVMRRASTTTLPVIAMLAQIALGVTAPFGLVFCVGETHAAVELAADDCCASHGSVLPTAMPTIERACCSDISLYAATRAVADGPRAWSPFGAALLAPHPVAVVPRASSVSPPVVGLASRLASSLGRTVVRRV